MRAPPVIGARVYAPRTAGREDKAQADSRKGTELGKKFLASRVTG